MTHIRLIRMMVGLVTATILALVATPAWAGDVPDTDTLPLFLLGLLLTLMIFRVQTAWKARKPPKD